MHKKRSHKKTSRVKKKPDASRSETTKSFISPARLSLYILVILILLGSWMRIGYVFQADHLPLVSDAENYVKMARGIAKRGTMSYGYSNEPSAYVMPGFPLILASFIRLFGEGKGAIQAVRFLFALMSITWIVLVYLIVYDLSEKKWLGVIAAGMVSFYPPFTWCSERILTEVPYTFFVVLTLFLLVRAWKHPRWHNSLLAGIFLGLSLLIRPIMLWFIPLFLVFDFLKERKPYKGFMIRLAVFIGAIILCLVPWIVRNAIQFKTFIPLSTSGGNPLLIGTYYNYNRTDAFPQGKSELETDRLQKELARKRFFTELKKSPFKYSMWYLQKIRSMWALSYGIYDGWNLPPIWRATVQLFHRIMVLGCILGILIAVLYFKKPWLLIIFFLFYHTMILVPFIGIPRYSFPMMPIACAVSALGFWNIYHIGRDKMEWLIREKKYLPIILVIAGIIVSLVWSEAASREVWLARGFGPSIGQFLSYLFKLVVFVLLLSPVVWLWKIAKERKQRIAVIILGLFLACIFAVTLTPALGFNIVSPLSNVYYREAYTFLVRPGDTLSKTIQLPPWIDKYDQKVLRIYMGFSRKAGKTDVIGLFIDDKIQATISGKDEIKPGWYEFPLPGKLTENKKKITVSLKKLTQKEATSPFLVGLRLRFKRGENSYNGHTDDLSPYMKGAQTGSYMIALKLVESKGERQMIWWGEK